MDRLVLRRQRIHQASCGEARARGSQRDGPARIVRGLLGSPEDVSEGELQSSRSDFEPLLAGVNDKPLAAQKTDER